MIMVLMMGFVINVLLLSATGQFLGRSSRPIRLILGALIQTAFMGLSLLPDFSFLHYLIWRLCALLVASFFAFGFSVKKFLLFSLLHLSLGGLSGDEAVSATMLLGALGLTFACLIVGRGNRFVPVELSYGGRTVKLTALRDTGNTLCDPITGRQVLIISADAAEKLTGLSESVFHDPVGAMGLLPGLRLIPYQTVGNAGFLLALPIQNVKIGDKRGNTLVAFSPRIFDQHYQALTGGHV